MVARRKYGEANMDSTPDLGLNGRVLVLRNTEMFCTLPENEAQG